LSRESNLSRIANNSLPKLICSKLIKSAFSAIELIEATDTGGEEHRPIAEGLLGVHIDPVARNRLRLNRIELGGIFKPVLEPLLRRD